MPIIRTYACPDCMHQMDVVLTMEQVDDPPPECPACARRAAMRQEFKPVAITGSKIARAGDLAEDIIQNDYNVADMNRARPGETRKIRYKDQVAAYPESHWQMAQGALEGAIAAGRQMRLKHGSGLDVLQANLKSGAQKDLIEISKQRSVKVW
jgi:putative FmdB family regulatory protein